MSATPSPWAKVTLTDAQLRARHLELARTGTHGTDTRADNPAVDFPRLFADWRRRHAEAADRVPVDPAD